MASEKVTSILEEIKGLSVIELFDLEPLPTNFRHYNNGISRWRM